jgi:hypothetical protein
MNDEQLARAYRALDLPFGAGLDEIRESYRALSRLSHPDRFERGTELYALAQARQTVVNESRKILKDWFAKNPGATPQARSPASEDSGGKPPEEINPEVSKEAHECGLCSFYEHDHTECLQPKRIRTVRDWVLDLMENSKPLMAGEIPMAKVPLHFLFWFGPIAMLSLLVTILGIPSTGCGAFIIACSAMLTVWLYIRYGQDVSCWKQESTPRFMYLSRGAADVFNSLTEELLEWQKVGRCWELVCSGGGKGRYFLRLRAEPKYTLLGKSIDQRIDCFVKVVGGVSDTNIWYSYDVVAPVSRKHAVTLMEELSQFLDNADRVT